MKLIKILFKLFFLLLLLIVIGVPVVLLVFGVQPEPLVQAGKSLSHQDVARIKTLLKQHDPRKLRDGEAKRLVMTERDLNLLLYSLPYASRQHAQVELGLDSAKVFYTLTLPDNPVGKYFNASVQLSQEAAWLVVDQVNIGDLAVPGWLINPLLGLVDGYLRRNFEEYRGMMAALHGFQLGAGEVRVVYQWRADLADQLQARGRELLLPEAEQQRLLAYYGALSRLSQSLGGTASLSQVLQPLFQLARTRTSMEGDPQAENRALLLTLGIAVRGSSIEKIIGEGGVNLPARPRSLKLTLRGRGDLAKHFAISAAVAVGGSSGLADAIGVFKELDDSRGGTGFSFADLLADRAGVELAKAATGSRAAEIQQRMSRSSREADFMPPIDQLPEGLMELEFKRRYEDLDSKTYGRVKQEIEKRIAACRVYR